MAEALNGGDDRQRALSALFAVVAAVRRHAEAADALTPQLRRAA